MIGLVSDNPAGLVGIKQFKDVKSKKNTALKQAKIADDIAKAIKSGHLSLHVVVCLGHGASWHRTGKSLLSTVPKSVAIAEGNGYRVMGQYIPLPTALAMGMYAAGLMLICLRTCIWAHRLKLDNVTVLMDRLPTSDVGDATKLLQAMQVHPDFYPAYKDMQDRFGVKLSFADQWTYNKPGDAPLSSKKHPNAILTDWIAQSAFAAANATQWLAVTRKRTEEIRKRVAAPFFALIEEKRVFVLNLSELQTEKEALAVASNLEQ